MKLKYSMMLLTLLFIANPLFGSITVNQSYTTDEGVFLLVGNRWLGAEAANFSPEGIFVLEEGQWISMEEAVNCDTYWTWTCRNCNEVNVHGAPRCRRCGKSA